MLHSDASGGRCVDTRVRRALGMTGLRSGPSQHMQCECDLLRFFGSYSNLGIPTIIRTCHCCACGRLEADGIIQESLGVLAIAHYTLGENELGKKQVFRVKKLVGLPPQLEVLA